MIDYCFWLCSGSSCLSSRAIRVSVAKRWIYSSMFVSSTTTFPAPRTVSNTISCIYRAMITEKKWNNHTILHITTRVSQVRVVYPAMSARMISETRPYQICQNKDRIITIAKSSSDHRNKLPTPVDHTAPIESAVTISVMLSKRPSEKRWREYISEATTWRRY